MPAPATGMEFTNVLTVERGLTNQIYLSGCGVAAGDVDGDGNCDLFFCGIDSPCRLYRNLGNWRFQDATAAAGLSGVGLGAAGATFADVDGDGDLDLLVTGISRGARLFLNDGKGRFTESPAGLDSHSAAMTVALADVDGDGDLDLYVANYRPDTFQDEPGVRFLIRATNGHRFIQAIDDKPVTQADRNRYHLDPAGNTVLENGEADGFYLNDGAGRFTQVSWTGGAFLDESGRPLAAAPLDWGYTAQFRDMTGDGAPDLYVCNDSESPDRVWINDGRGRFRALPALAMRQTPVSSMSIDFADINRDGVDDFFVSDMLSRDHRMRHTLMSARHPLPLPGQIDDRPAVGRNMLYLGRGDGSYAEIAQLAGLDATDWTWSPLFLDVDLDGYEDLLITTGLERSLRDADARMQIARAKAQKRLTKHEFLDLRRRLMPRLESRNWVFRNRGDLTFETAGAAWGFDSTLVSHGIVTADLDNDGDLDVIVNCMNGPALIYRNNTSAPRVMVRLKGARPNTRGIGARIRFLGGPVPQSQEMICGGHYLSGDDPARVFAAGSLTNRLSLSVTWRSGRVTALEEVKPNRVYEVAEPAAEGPYPPPVPRPAPPAPLFRDVSERLAHTHVETDFNDFERQPLLPRKLSRPGPAVCWTDLNGDGWDDILIGCGPGGQPSARLNDTRGGFVPAPGFPAQDAPPGETVSILGLPGPGGARVWLGRSTYRTSDGSPAVLALAAPGERAGVLGSVAAWESSVGPMAIADLRGEGRLSLFAGGRVVPGRYPEPASSRLFRIEEGRLAPDLAASAVLEKAGLVSGAVFTDLDGDGLPELVLAVEWGPLRIFRNRGGALSPWDWPVQGAACGTNLSAITGWWNSVVAGDFDGDGRLDLAAGNWGRNTRQQFYLPQPLRLCYGDINGAGQVDLVDAHFEPALNKHVPWRYWDSLARALPFLQERFPSFASYSTAGVEELLEGRMDRVHVASAVTLDSMVFLNRGDFFQARSLPLEAQMSPVFGLVAADFDGDGREDLFLAQNSSAVDNETSRYDAGRGLLLAGDGRGGFAALSGAASGILIHGEQRGAAACDYDRDGRVDLLAGQTGAATILLRNEGARPGLRVCLKGPAGNPGAVGAVLRLLDGGLGSGGFAREVHAGAGYASQDSLVQVLPAAAHPARVQVRWPGGKTTTADVPEGAREVQIDMAAGLKAIH